MDPDLLMFVVMCLINGCFLSRLDVGKMVLDECVTFPWTWELNTQFPEPIVYDHRTILDQLKNTRASVRSIMAHLIETRAFFFDQVDYVVFREIGMDRATVSMGDRGKGRSLVIDLRAYDSKVSAMAILLGLLAFLASFVMTEIASRYRVGRYV